MCEISRLSESIQMPITDRKRNRNGPVTIKNADYLIVKSLSFPQWKCPRDFSAEFGQMRITVFSKFFQKTKKDNNSHFIFLRLMLSLNLLSQLAKRVWKNEIYKPVSLMNNRKI